MNEPSNESDRVFEIPSPNFGEFKAKWEKLIKRANKLGVTPPNYLVIKEEPRLHKVKRQRWNDVKGEYETYYEETLILYHHVKIEHPLVIVNGWEFRATLEHTEEGNITHNISGHDLPAKYLDCPAWCDHCQMRRNRKDTFVVYKEETQEYQQVGRNCLADFLGVDGTMYANMAEIYHTASELGEASEGGDGDSWGSGGETYDYLDRFLSHVAEVISHEGWKSRKTAKEVGGPSTSDIAYSHMHPGPYQKKEDRLYEEPSEKSVEKAKEAIVWCENLADTEVENSEYLHNIRVIARRGIIGWKQYGYAASIVSAYDRTIVEKITKERQAKLQATSDYVGEIGKRQNFTVVVEKVVALESAYGTKHMHIMAEMPSGNRLTWFSTSAVLDVGVIMVIKATPKKHEEYKGVKQTILSRCSAVE